MACTPHATAACADGDVYWFDSCGAREDLKEDCAEASCSLGACVTAPCAMHDRADCADGDVYWFDSCGGREELKEDCAGAGCQRGVCAGVSCAPHASAACSGGDVYWFDSCGVREDVKEHCVAGCTGDVCDCEPGLTRCGDACVDLSTDLDHCGGCEQACTATGSGVTASCAASTCFVTRDLYAVDALTNVIAIDGSHVYWFEKDTTPFGSSQRYKLVRGPKAGGIPTVLAGQLDYPGDGLVVEGGRVYWTTGGDLMRVPASGGVVTALSTNHHYRLAADAQRLYFFTEVGAGIWAVESMPLVGGARELLAGVIGGPVAIAVDSTRVLWTSDGGKKVRAASKDGGLPDVLSDAEDSATSVIAHAGFVYWANYLSDGSIKRTSGSVVQAVASGHGNPNAMAAHAGFVYWVGYTAGLYRIGVAGGPETKLGSGYASAVKADASGVYWFRSDPSAGSSSGRIRVTAPVIP